MGTCFSKKPSATTTNKKESSCSNVAAATVSAAGAPKAALKKPVNSLPVAVPKKKSPRKPVKDKPKFPLTEISNLNPTTNNNNNNKSNKKSDEDATQAPKEEGRENTATIITNNSNNKPQRDETPVLAKTMEKKECAVRTSSCTKEEVDAILIQCGRLSRSSSGKSSNETKDPRTLTSSTSTKRHSGSKRHLEHQGDEKENIEDHADAADDEGRGKMHRSGRSSHKRTPSGGEMGGVVEYYYKRSSSRERNTAEQQSGKRNAGGEARRKVSRSPGKRQEATPEKSNRALQSARSASSEIGGRPVVNKRNHNLTSRSRSPAAGRSANTAETNSTHPTQTLSRSSSKKTDRSPYRRPVLVSNSTPTVQDPTDPSMTITTTTNGATEEEEGKTKKINHQSHARSHSVDGSSGAGSTKDHPSSGSTTITLPHIREQLLACRAKQVQRQPSPAKTPPVSEKVPIEGSAEITEEAHLESESRTLTRSISGRRSAVESVIDSLPESPELYLPACVSKACSILEAVADLNAKGTAGRVRDVVSFELLDSAIRHSEDNQYSNSLHKYVSVRREMVTQPAYSEGQESSAGSNTVMTCSSPWEPASADSTDRWFDGNSFNKLMVPEEVNSASSSSSKYRFAGGEDLEEAGRVVAGRSNSSAELEKNACGRYNGRLRSENMSNNSGSRFMPVITLSNSMKRETFRDGNVMVPNAPPGR